MENKISNLSNLGVVQYERMKDTRSHDIAVEAFSRVIGESWQKGVKGDKPIYELMQEHADNMRSILGSFDYEVNTIHNIIANIKRMSKSDARQYTKIIEALAFGYKARLGAELAAALLTGISIKAKDTDSVRKFSDMLLEEIDARMRYEGARISKSNRSIEQLTVRQRYYESSLLRFLNRKKIAAIRRRIAREREKINGMEEKMRRNKEFATSIRKMLGADETNGGGIPL